MPTLKKLLQVLPDLKFIVAPSAKDKLEAVADKEKITVLPPGRTLELPTNSNVECSLTAVEGALVGPPWQSRENGWLLKTTPQSGDATSIFMNHMLT